MGPQAEANGADAVAGSTLRFDRKHHVLLITFAKVATEASALATYAAVERFVAAEGPCSVIADLSTIEKLEVRGDLVRSIAWMPPAIPSGNLGVIVAPRAAVYGLSRCSNCIETRSRVTFELSIRWRRRTRWLTSIHSKPLK